MGNYLMTKLKIIILSILIVSCKAKESPIDLKIDKVLNSDSFTFKRDIDNGCMSPVSHLSYHKKNDSIFFILNDSIVKKSVFENEIKNEVAQFIKDGAYYSTHGDGLGGLYWLINSTDTVVFDCNKKGYYREFVSRFDLDLKMLDSLNFARSKTYDK